MEDYRFEIKNVDEVDMLEILKPELAKALGKLEDGYVNDNSIILHVRNPWTKKEPDGKTYNAKYLYITFSIERYRPLIFSYVVKLTPFNCYICDEATHRHGLVNPSKYPDLRDKDLTKFYRRTMQKLYGESWTNAFKAYMERVKKHKKGLLDKAYNDSLKEIEYDIAEEQAF